MSVWQMSLSASALIAIAVIVRALAMDRLPKKTFLALWGLALCRLLVPYTLPSRFSAYSLLERVGAVFPVNPTPGISAVWQAAGAGAGASNPGLPAETAAAAAHGMLAAYVPVAVWLVGTAVCAVFFTVAYWKCRAEFGTSLPIENTYMRQWQDSRPMKRNVAVRVSDRIASPLTYGIKKPVILFPKEMDFTDETKLSYILAHEYVHIRRFDAVTKLLLAAAVCVHWFNPLAWAMYILANRDIELSCDETVVSSLGSDLKSAYAMMLIGMEEAKSSPVSLGAGFSKYAIEERINSIMKIRKASLAGIIIACTLVVCTAAVFATTRIWADTAGENIIQLLGGGRIESGMDSADNHYASVDTSFVSDPVEVRNGQVYFVLDGSGTNITSYCTEETYYLYEQTADNGYRHAVLVGGAPDNLGWAEFVWDESGGFAGGNAKRNTDDVPAWLMRGQETLGAKVASE
jgi:beta-lactamase regulating signal transducer with metallopeptidase domain